MENLKPKHARTRPKGGANPADDRDRLAALLVSRHALLRKIAGYFHPRDVDAVVPPLLSAKRAPAVEPEAVADTPAPVVLAPHAPA